jgi:hypothetical protein
VHVCNGFGCKAAGTDEAAQNGLGHALDVRSSVCFAAVRPMHRVQFAQVSIVQQSSGVAFFIKRQDLLRGVVTNKENQGGN